MNTRTAESPNRAFVRAASLAGLPDGARITVNLDGHVIALFHTPEGIFAVDNRCPHMGFPPRSRHREGLHPHLSLASRALRPAQRRRIRSVGRRRARVPRQGRRRRHLDRSRPAWRREPASRRAPARRHRAQYLTRHRQVGDREARRDRRCARAVSHRTRIRNALPARRLGRRPDHSNLHDEPAAAAAPRGSRACDVPRAVLGSQRFLRPSTALRDASAAGWAVRVSRRSSDGCADSSKFATRRAPSDASSRRFAWEPRRAKSAT